MTPEQIRALIDRLVDAGATDEEIASYVAQAKAGAPAQVEPAESPRDKLLGGATSFSKRGLDDAMVIGADLAATVPRVVGGIATVAGKITGLDIPRNGELGPGGKVLKAVADKGSGLAHAIEAWGAPRDAKQLIPKLVGGVGKYVAMGPTGLAVAAGEAAGDPEFSAVGQLSNLQDSKRPWAKKIGEVVSNIDNPLGRIAGEVVLDATVGKALKATKWGKKAVKAEVPTPVSETPLSVPRTEATNPIVPQRAPNFDEIINATPDEMLFPRVAAAAEQVESLIPSAPPEQMGDLITARHALMEKSAEIEQAQNITAKVAEFQATPPNAVPSAVAQGLGGFAFGVGTAENDEERMTNAVLWAAIAAGGAYSLKGFLQGKVKRAKPPSVIPNSQAADLVMVNAEDLQKHQIPFFTMMRAFYTEATNSTFQSERIYEKLGLMAKDAGDNAVKKLQMFGRAPKITDEWFTDRVTFTGRDGNPVQMLDDQGNPVKPIQHIIQKTARGHKEDLGKLMMARTTIQQYGMGRKDLALTEGEARAIAINAPEWLHDAADEMRQFSKAALRVMRAVGMLSDEAYQTMSLEDMYAPLVKAIEGGYIERMTKEKANLIQRSKAMFDRTKAGASVVLNPVDATIEITARILRAVEYYDAVSTMKRNLDELPGGIGEAFMSKAENRISDAYTELGDKAKELAKAGIMPEEQAKNFLVLMGEQEVPRKTGATKLLPGFENGKPVTYKIDPGFFRAFKALKPIESKFIIALAKPAKWGTSLVVSNPAFAVTQSLIDTFQATLTSEHNFIPVASSWEGFKASVQRSDFYRDLESVGGVGAIHQLKHGSDTKTLIRNMERTGHNVLESSIERMKHVEPLEASKILFSPFAEAARVGEAMRAAGHGASVLEAAWAARNVMGNTQMQGAATAVRAFHMMTMFSRPAIAAVDATIFYSGLPHPKRFDESHWWKLGMDEKRLAKFMMLGVGSISLPTAMLWWVNKDDAEINELRKTKTGSKHIFWRGPGGEIMRTRKPHIIGQIFGTTMEMALDRLFEKDPGAVSAFGAMLDDAAVGMVPTWGVVPLAVWSNKVPGLGMNLVPPRDENQLPSQWGSDRASLPARIISEKVTGPAMEAAGIENEPVQRLGSPAGIDLVVRTIGGMWGEDAMKAVTAARDWVAVGAPPPMQQFPLIGRFFAKQPTANQGSIQSFYEVAKKIDHVSTTVDRYVKEGDVEKLGTYTADKAQELKAAGAYNQARGEIAQLWRAIHDIRDMNDDILDKKTKLIYEEHFINAILEKAKAANQVGSMFGLR